MNFLQRKRLILSVLADQGSAEVPELSNKLKVSEITVRRDLAELANKGLIVRTHGGAMNLKLAQDPVGFTNKAMTHAAEKEYIAQLAAVLIQDGDIIFMDCGSTVFAMHTFLKSKSAKVITNSVPLAMALSGSKMSVNLIGGELDQERMAAHGSIAVEHIQRYNATKAFIGADGVSLKSGLTSHSEKEAEISLAIAQRADRVYLLCDSSKLEREKYFRFAPLSLVNTVITDQKAPEEILRKYRKAGIEVIHKNKK